MVNKIAQKSGNWSDTTVWNGGTLPASGDDVYANNFTVDIDQNITVASLRTTSGSGITAGGSFTVTSGTRAISVTAGILAATHSGVNSQPILTVNGGTVTLTATVTGGGATGRHAVTMAGGTLTVVGNVTGGTGSSVYGVHFTAGSLTVTGNVTGGSTSSAAGVYMNGPSLALSVTGTVTGGTNASAYGVWAGGAATNSTIGIAGLTSANTAIGLIVTAVCAVTVGSVQASTASAGSYGVSFTAAATLDITGTVEASTTAVGINSTVSTVARVSGTLVWSGYYPPISGFHIRASASMQMVFPDATYWPSASPVGPNVTLSVQGANNPAPADVRDGVTYGAGGALEGTLAVPSPSSVAAGVPTDDTVGTAALRLADVAAVTGGQLAAALT